MFLFLPFNFPLLRKTSYSASSVSPIFRFFVFPPAGIISLCVRFCFLWFSHTTCLAASLVFFFWIASSLFLAIASLTCPDISLSVYKLSLILLNESVHLYNFQLIWPFIGILVDSFRWWYHGLITVLLALCRKSPVGILFLLCVLLGPSPMVETAIASGAFLVVNVLTVHQLLGSDYQIISKRIISASCHYQIISKPCKHYVNTADSPAIAKSVVDMVCVSTGDCAPDSKMHRLWWVWRVWTRKTAQ